MNEAGTAEAEKVGYLILCASAIALAARKDKHALETLQTLKKETLSMFNTDGATIGDCFDTAAHQEFATQVVDIVTEGLDLAVNLIHGQANK